MAHIFILTILAFLITKPGIKDYLKIRTGIMNRCTMFSYLFSLSNFQYLEITHIFRNNSVQFILIFFPYQFFNI